MSISRAEFEKLAQTAFNHASCSGVPGLHENDWALVRLPNGSLGRVDNTTIGQLLIALETDKKRREDNVLWIVVNGTTISVRGSQVTPITSD